MLSSTPSSLRSLAAPSPASDVASSVFSIITKSFSDLASVVLRGMPNNPDKASTIGFDVVSSLRLDVMNAQLASSFTKHDLLERYDFAYNDDSFGPLNAAGRIVSWAVDHGTGEDVVFNVTLASSEPKDTEGRLNAPKASATGASWDITGQILKIQLPLEMVSGPVANTRKLQIKQSLSRSEVTVLDVVPTAGKTALSPSVAKPAVQGFFQAFFVAHGNDVKHTMACINLVGSPDAASTPQWLVPTGVMYRFSDTTDPSRSFISVLAVTGPNPEQRLHNLTALVSPAALCGEQAGMVITGPLFLINTIKPCLEKQFGATFNYNAGLKYLANAGGFNFPKANGYTPVCNGNDFRVGIMNYKMWIYTKVHVDISSGITGYVETTSTYEISASNGKLDLKQLSTDSKHWQDVAWWVYLTSGLAALFTGGLALSVEGLIFGALVGVLPLIIKAITDTSLGPGMTSTPIDGAIENCIKWTLVDSVDITNSEFGDDSVMIGCSVKMKQ